MTDSRHSPHSRPALARDLGQGLRRYDIWGALAFYDVAQRFHRSTLGPFWITISTGIMIIALGYVFGSLFGQDVVTFVPHVACGLIFWGLLNATLGEACTTFVEARGYVHNVPMPLSVHYYKIFFRNLIVWLHNMVIYFAILAFVIQDVSLNMLWFFPGFVIFCVFCFSVGLFCAVVSARFRDIPQLIMSVLQVLFLVTPVFWSTDALPDRPAFIELNPLYHFLEIVRAPLLGKAVDDISWIVTILLSAVSFLVAFALYAKSYKKIPFWV